MKTMPNKQVADAYDGSDGALTRRLLKNLEDKELHGCIAAQMFRAQKASSRAKRYKGDYKGYAYDRKEQEIQKLCVLLAQQQDWPWGWQRDETDSFAPEWLLYVDLPTGQVSWHCCQKLTGETYPGEWDRMPGTSEGRILRFCEAVLQGEDLSLVAAQEEIRRACPHWARHCLHFGSSDPVGAAIQKAGQEIYERHWMEDVKRASEYPVANLYRAWAELASVNSSVEVSVNHESFIRQYPSYVAERRRMGRQPMTEEQFAQHLDRAKEKGARKRHRREILAFEAARFGVTVRELRKRRIKEGRVAADARLAKETFITKCSEPNTSR